MSQRLIMILSLCTLVFGCIYYARINLHTSALYGPNPPLQQSVTPESTIFAFDLNQVVLMADKAAIHDILYNMPKKELLFFLFNPLNWPCIITTARKQQRAEYFFKELLISYPQLALYKSIYFELFTAMHLNEKVVKIIEHLKHMGFTCYAFSDLGPKALAANQEKFPILTTLFDKFYLPPCCNKITIKSNPLYHQAFKNYVTQTTGKQQIIFIDNSETNIVAARNAGIYSILFLSAAHIEQQLQNFGLYIYEG